MLRRPVHSRGLFGVRSCQMNNLENSALDSMPNRCSPSKLTPQLNILEYAGFIQTVDSLNMSLKGGKIRV